MSGEYKVNVSWSWRDVKSCREKWSKAKCIKALASIGDSLEESQINDGWFALSTLIDNHESELKQEKGGSND